MKYKNCYRTKEIFSDIILTSDGEHLTGLFFAGNKDIDEKVEKIEEKDLAIFEETKRWLDTYFDGKIPKFTLKYKIDNLTPFRKEVLETVSAIPYGRTITYGEIARKIAEKHNISRMSAQAVGAAVGFNPISIIVPCHRVIGSDGSPVGYGGGIDNKMELLKLEKAVVTGDGCVVKY